MLLPYPQAQLRHALRPDAHIHTVKHANEVVPRDPCESGGGGNVPSLTRHLPDAQNDPSFLDDFPSDSN